MPFWYRIPDDMFQKIRLASLVEVMPMYAVITPSYSKSTTIQGMILNSSPVPITFKLKATQGNFLTARPAFGSIAPNEGHVFFLKLNQIRTPAFRMKRDHLSVYVAAHEINADISRPEMYWKEPLGPPKVCVHRIVVIQYNPMNETPPWLKKEATTTSSEQSSIEEDKSSDSSEDNTSPPGDESEKSS